MERVGVVHSASSSELCSDLSVGIELRFSTNYRLELLKCPAAWPLNLMTFVRPGRGVGPVSLPATPSSVFNIFCGLSAAALRGTVRPARNAQSHPLTEIKTRVRVQGAPRCAATQYPSRAPKIKAKSSLSAWPAVGLDAFRGRSCVRRSTEIQNGRSCL